MVVRIRVDHVAKEVKDSKLFLVNCRIMYGGDHVLSNEVIREIIRYILQPINSDTMADMLSTSVYRVSTYEQFKADAAIVRNFRSSIIST